MINFRLLSKYLTGKETTIRANSIPLKYRASIKELNDLIEYWKSKNNPYKGK